MQENSIRSDIQLLTDVREQAIGALVGILPQIENIDSVERFNITLGALRSTDNKQLLQPTLDAALRIEDKEIQANSLLELINETDFLIDQSAQPQQAKPSEEDSSRSPIVVR